MIETAENEGEKNRLFVGNEMQVGVKRGVEGWLEVRQPHSPDPAVFAHVSYSQRPTKNRRR